MEKVKFRIEVIDFMLYAGKFTSGYKDVDGIELFLGDTVEKNGEKFLIAYRYGQFVIKPPLSGCYMSLSNESNIKKLNQITAVPGEYIAIGFTDEPVYSWIRNNTVKLLQ